MKPKKSLLAALYKPVKIDLTQTGGPLRIRIDRITGSGFKPEKQPVKLLKEIPVLDLSNKGLFLNAKVHVRLNFTFEFAITDEVIKSQSEFMRGIIGANKDFIKELALKNWKIRNGRGAGNK